MGASDGLAEGGRSGGHEEKSGRVGAEARINCPDSESKVSVGSQMIRNDAPFSHASKPDGRGLFVVFPNVFLKQQPFLAVF